MGVLVSALGGGTPPLPLCPGWDVGGETPPLP